MKLHPIIRKISITALTALMLSCLPQWAMSQGNLVVNGGFDTDASGWTITNVSEGDNGYASNIGNPPGSVFLYDVSSLNVPTASQEISSLTPGALYIVSGDYAGGGKGVANNSFGVALDGVYLFETNAPPTYNWYSFSFDYTATSTSALLSISAQLNGTGYPYTIDNIAMYAVPEPSAICLILLGSGVLIYVRTRHKRHSR